MFWLELIAVGVICYWAGKWRTLLQFAKAEKNGQIEVLNDDQLQAKANLRKVISDQKISAL